MRLVAAAVLLALLIVLGARPIGHAPALGSFLDPAHGVWALARNAELPNEDSDVIPALATATPSSTARALPEPTTPARERRRYC